MGQNTKAIDRSAPLARRERERTEPDRPTDDHRVTMKTSRALALAALGALAVSGAVHCEPSVLDGNLLEDHVSVGIVNDLPAEIMQELTKHVHEFLEEIRPGIHGGIQKEIFEFKIDPELEALTVAESYFENPETSVLAERMLSVCESDMKNCPLLQHLPEEERVASKVVYADEGEEAGNGRKLQQVGGAKTYNTGNPNTKVPFLDVAAPLRFTSDIQLRLFDQLYRRYLRLRHPGRERQLGPQDPDPDHEQAPGRLLQDPLGVGEVRRQHLQGLRVGEGLQFQQRHPEEVRRGHRVQHRPGNHGGVRQAHGEHANLHRCA